MKYTLANFARLVVSVMIGFVSVILCLRFILKFFAANPNNDFVSWIYDTSSEVLGPFRNIFPTVRTEGFVVEFSTIFALFVYIITALAAFYLIDVLTVIKETRRK